MLSIYSWSLGDSNEGRRKQKGWVLVCERIPPYHKIAIAEAGEDKNSICKAYIINEMFLQCVQAAQSRLQTSPLRTRPDADPGVNIRGDGII